MILTVPHYVERMRKQHDFWELSWCWHCRCLGWLGEGFLLSGVCAMAVNAICLWVPAPLRLNLPHSQEGMRLRGAQTRGEASRSATKERGSGAQIAGQERTRPAKAP